MSQKFHNAGRTYAVGPAESDGALAARLAKSRARDAVDRLTRAELIRICQRNDHNGCWTDADCKAEGLPRASVSQLRAIVRDWIADDATEEGRAETLRTFLQWVNR